MLNKTIILFARSYNPDGIQRFSYCANTNKSINLNSYQNYIDNDEVCPVCKTNY